MKSTDEQLITSLHRSVEQIMSMFKLVKSTPPDLSAKSIVEYARLIEKLLMEFYAVIPKMCVPMSLFRKIEKESLQISELAEKYLQQHRNSLIEIKVLKDKLRESEDKQKILTQEKNNILKNNQYYRKKAQSLKKSGEQSLKNLIEISSPIQPKPQKRHSLPRLDQKEKLAMLYLMGPVSNNNERLVYHLFNKK